MESLGSYLKRERELRQISVAEVAQTTRIPIRIIVHLENDELESLPADIFVRGYLRAYARALSIDDGDVLARHQRKPEPDRPAPLPAVYAPEPGRRFGLALALVILLILFTLALSIVLRPRHRDAPIELSRQEVPCLRVPNTTTPSFSAASITATPTASSRC
ncbi:MAG TPA: helix-turn-helix domain-containing protein [Polyangiales bacterium]|nr:helix-turn-helix domain-containing protein [Polyangiales bacterium]